MKTHMRGFTLIELSVVLVIIALIIGGIVVGKSMVRQSQINSVSTDVQRYTQAFQNFQQKYGALPGDFPNATSYWGAMSSCPPTYGSASPGGTLTCNGDGNNQIDPMSTNNTAYEMYLAWQHLANAQMIQGQYTGIAGSAGWGDSVIGVNVPQSRLPSSGFSVADRGTIAPAPGWFPANYGHIIWFGEYHSGSVTDYDPLTAVEAQAFDSKFDDGSPASGSVMSYTSYWDPGCVTTTVPSTAAYNISTSGPQCALIFITGF